MDIDSLADLGISRFCWKWRCSPQLFAPYLACPCTSRRLCWSVLHNSLCLELPSHQRAYQVLTTWASPKVARLGPAMPAMNTKASNIHSGGYSDSKVIRM